MLQKGDERVTDTLARAAEAEERAASAADPQAKAGYEVVATAWRQLATSFDFQRRLSRFISVKNKSPHKGSSSDRIGPNRAGLFPLPAKILEPASPDIKRDLLDWIARTSDQIRPYSIAAFAIAAASVTIATLLHVIGGWASSGLPFAIYLPAILATGLLAGVPAALGAAVVSVLIIVWAFMPPYFSFKWLNEVEQLNVFFNAVPYLLTVYFAHLSRIVLHRLRRGELNNRVLARELAHRSRNLFSVIEVVVQKTLANDQRADVLFGRLRSIQYANELLTQKTGPVSISTLLLKEFAPYGEERLVMRGPDLEIGLESIRHLVLLFHELTTNAAKYGALSTAWGRVVVEWQWNGSRIALTWKESDGPLVVPPTRQGFGSQLMGVCAKALDGKVRPVYLPDGFSCSMNLRVRSTSIPELRAE